QVGLEAAQIMLPVEDLLLAPARAFPSIVVVLQKSGLTHFVVAWRRHGSLVQVMDPVVGRRWLRHDAFLASVYRHRALVSAASWREWIRSEESLALFPPRFRSLGLERAGRDWLRQAESDPSWRTFAALDAATRAVHGLVRSHALARGGEARRTLETFVAAE